MKTIDDLVAQMDKIDKNLSSRKNIGKYYDKGKAMLTNKAKETIGIKAVDKPKSKIESLASNPYVWLGVGVLVVGSVIIYKNRKK
jgi:hypothetical protein